MASATEHLVEHTWAQAGVRDVYADFNELTLTITTNALFGVDMSSSQAAGISGAQPASCSCSAACMYDQQQRFSSVSSRPQW